VLAAPIRVRCFPSFAQLCSSRLDLKSNGFQDTKITE
jgi:hypothetical protein